MRPWIQLRTMSSACDIFCVPREVKKMFLVLWKVGSVMEKRWKLNIFVYTSLYSTRGQGELRFSRSAFWYENGSLFCFFASVDHLTQSFRRIRIEQRYFKHFLKCPKITLNHSKQYFCTLETSRRPPFLFWLLLIDGAVDQSETPLILKLRPSSVYQGSIYQFWSSGFDDTWRQPKGVELGN